MSFHNYLGLCAATLLVLVLPSCTLAATIAITPATATATVGTSLTQTVTVSSADQALNAVSGTLTFAPDTVQVISISKSPSILTLWVTEPTFSNVDGTITFSGIVPNPGYQGSRGQLFTIVFRARTVGSTQAAFRSGEVLANDGNGTNIYKGSQPASLTITAAPTMPPTPVPPAPKPEPIKIVPVSKPAGPVATTTATTTPVAATTTPALTTEPLAVQAPPLLDQSWLAINYLSVLLIVLAVLGTLAFGAWYIHVHFSAYRRDLHRKLGITHARVHKEFDTLREALLEELGGLSQAESKRELTREEKRISTRLKKLLDQAEEAIERDIEHTSK